jgi:hypothetical protein
MTTSYEITALLGKGGMGILESEVKELGHLRTVSAADIA